MIEHPALAPHILRLEGGLDAVMGLSISTVQKLLGQLTGAPGADAPLPGVPPVKRPQPCQTFAEVMAERKKDPRPPNFNEGPLKQGPAPDFQPVKVEGYQQAPVPECYRVPEPEPQPQPQPQPVPEPEPEPELPPKDRFIARSTLAAELARARETGTPFVPAHYFPPFPPPKQSKKQPE